MPRSASLDGLDKFQRFRAARREKGLRLLRIWVPDPHTPGFRGEVERQASLLREASEENDALDFIAAVAERDDAGT